MIPLDGPHEDVTVSEDGRTAYVTGGFTRDGHGNGITVVDLDAGTARRLPAGQPLLGHRRSVSRPGRRQPGRARGRGA